MAIKQFVVGTYKQSLGHALESTWGGVQIEARGYIACYGGDHRFIIYFLAENSPVPQPVYIPANKFGAIFVNFSECLPYVDMLRNEKPIYAYLNSDKPEWNSITTSAEPVGEGET
jgi:hypothetical protein